MISNASPLIVFGSLNRIDLLVRVYGKITIPKEVYEEVVLGKNSPDAKVVGYAIECKDITVLEADPVISARLQRTFVSLDYGETATISLALSRREKEVLIDDGPARRAAKLNGLIPRGSLRVLLESYKNGFTSEDEIRSLLKQMTSSKFRVSSEVITLFWELFEKSKRSKTL